MYDQSYSPWLKLLQSIPSGSHVALSGFAITRCTMAFAREVIRQGIQEFTVSQCVGAMDADLLVGAGRLNDYLWRWFAGPLWPPGQC